MSDGLLRDLVDQVTTKATGVKPNGGKYVGLEDIEPGSTRVSSFSPSSVSTSTNGVFEEGDILFGKLRPNLRKSARTDFSGYCSTDFIIMRARPGVDPRYASHVASSEAVFRHAEQNSIGTGMPRTSWGAVSLSPVHVPPVDEQRRIAEVLDTIDDTIRTTERSVAKLTSLRLGLHQELVLGPDPSDWVERSVGECCELFDRLRKPLSVEERDHIHGPYPYYGPTGLLDWINEFQLDGEFALIGEDGDHFLKFEHMPMTQLVSGQLNVNNHAHVVRGGPTCLTEWFATYFRHYDVGLALTRQGAGRFKLNQASLLSLRIRLPPRDEQARILQVINNQQALLDAEALRLGKLRLLRSGLAHDLLSGQVRVAAV